MTAKIDKIPAIIQARITSKRFPEKVMSFVNQKTIIVNIIERLQKCKNISRIYLAIPEGEKNETLIDLVKFFDIQVIASPEDENDVARRFLDICDVFDIRDFVRVCGDSPFIQPWVIDYAVEYYLKEVPQYVLTTGMPDGMNAEVIDAKALEEAYPKMTTEEKEHVTLHFERNPYIFDNRKLDLKHMSVDTVNDLNRLKEIAKYDI